MARQGVFNREITQMEQIKRSLQMLEHRHSTTLEYGVIIPNFTEFLYPNETLRLKTTNFLRTIPLKTPQLTRVRIVQRFVAFPLRLLWEFFPEYINALNPPKEGIPEEPYIVNFNSFKRYPYTVQTDSFGGTSTVDLSTLSNYGYEDLSAMSIGNKVQADVTAKVPSYGRSLTQFNDTPVPSPVLVGDAVGYQFFPHELGDYLNMPLYSASLARDVSNRVSAYKFAAYQLAYSFFYRRPNIEERIDDWYEMAQSGYKDQLFSEYPALYAHYNPSTGALEPPITSALSHIASGDSRAVAARKASPSGLLQPDSNSITFHEDDWAQSSDTAQIRASTWENVEHFPLKSGPNICMQAKYVDANGRTNWQDSTISLFRLRYAPWFMDRFTSANPWPQRGDEALIPVQGSIAVTLPDSTTVTFSNLSASVPEHSIRLRTHGFENDGSFNANAVEFKSESYTGSVPTFGAVSTVTGVETGSLTGTGAYANLISPAQSASVSGSASAAFSSSSANVAYSLSVSPSNFRFYMQLQHMKEMSGMTDGRYKSFLSMFFGSHDKDYRLDRPEFIGGFVQDLDVSEVTQTSEGSDPLGTLAGKGVSAKRGSTIQYHAFEHALVMGFLHIVPDSEYIGGLNIQDNTTDPFDWILPQFSGLSEQPIRMKELVCLPSKLSEAVNDDNNVVFGYEPRFNQRRARHSYVTGDFRDTMNSGGNYQYFKPWLITRNFGFDVDFVNATSGGVTYLQKLQFNVPSLSKEFVNMRHNVDYSNFSITDPSLMKPFILDSYFEERLTAIIPRRGIPKI